MSLPSRTPAARVPGLGIYVHGNTGDAGRLDLTVWSGELDEVDFPGRLYELDMLPSNDTRYHTAREDIIKHRVANLDWDDNWIFSDPRFGLAESDAQLVRFLADMLHPAVRTDLAEVEETEDLH